jgi:predicted nucleic acid-binding protein
VSATLARKLKAGQISQTAHQQKQRELLTDWSLFIQIQFIDEILTEALRLTSSFALKGADAIHLASASVLKCTVDDSVQMMMMTSDRELASAASMIGIEVTDPTE